MKIKNLFIFIFLFGLSNLVCSQEFDLKLLQIEKEIDVPEFIINMIEDSIIQVTTIDFTGDNIEDYIIWIQTDSLKRIDEGFVFELFLSSDQIVWSKDIRYIYVDIFERRFVNLDSDVELEILELSGYADGVDNYVFDYTQSEKKYQKLFWFDFEKSNLYSPLDHKYIIGYNLEKMIYVKIINMPEFESEISIPKTQIKLPVFYFVNEQSEIEGLQIFYLYSVEKIYNLVHKKIE